ncbi:MAG: DUF3137 domain-containing protein [Marinilabiliales bacterium]|nr:MAG: DUF3137 domain-containing protein [Marinilabiliales bacterium]
MKTLEEFENYYNKSLKTDLVNLDARRKQVVKRFLISLFAIFIPSMAIFILTGLYVGIAASVIAFIILLFFWVRDKLFVKDFKEQVINRIVYFISPDLTYDPKGHISLSEFVTSRLFLTSVDRYNGDDLVYGTIDKTEFRFSEFKAEYKQVTTDSKGRTRTSWHTIFRGIFYIADFNKEFTGSTVVLPNVFGNRFGFMKKLMGATRREKLVKLEDPDFSRQFNVYSDDQVKARYVLSTSLMQRIVDFRKKHKNNVYLSFVDSKMYLGVSHNKNLFEPNYLRSLVRFDVLREYFDDLVLAVGIVEDMNLNTRIWTKT